MYIGLYIQTSKTSGEPSSARYNYTKEQIKISNPMNFPFTVIYSKLFWVVIDLSGLAKTTTKLIKQVQFDTKAVEQTDNTYDNLRFSTIFFNTSTTTKILRIADNLYTLVQPQLKERTIWYKQHSRTS